MNTDRMILHSDCNCFFASVEMLSHPEYREVPMAVGGDRDSRRGIILTANYVAKAYGVKTGMTIGQAKAICPKLVLELPHMEEYKRYSKLVMQIYSDYTQLLEPFGIDESWLDISEIVRSEQEAYEVACEINRRIKEELGITVSIGVSFNKVFAKLGSDYKKPDAVTTIFRDEYRQIVWPLSVDNLLFVGKKTKEKLNSIGIHTIGELAQFDKGILVNVLGKNGELLWEYANGLDESPVCSDEEETIAKSIGNSTTASRDMVTDEEVKIVIFSLAETVASRMRNKGVRCRCVEISVRDNELVTFSHQCKISGATDITIEIANEAYKLFKEFYTWSKPIRSVGIRCTDLVDESFTEQMEWFCDYSYKEKQKKADEVIDDIRKKFGNDSIKRGLILKDENLSNMKRKE